MHMDTVKVEREGPVWVITIDRPHVRNAVDGPTARALVEAFEAFEADADARVAVLAGAGGHFCAGADLKTVAGEGAESLALNEDLSQPGPMGPTRLRLTKPVVAAVAGYCVAGGLELALWCDLRVAGTVRLPRLIGESRALDLILTGRVVDADDAFAMGLATRKVRAGQALPAARALAAELAELPQTCLRSDLASVRAQAGLPWRDAMAQEFALGLATLRSGESKAGAARFTRGAGRHGKRDDG
jgi:enoyl-CoA hydratase